MRQTITLSSLIMRSIASAGVPTAFALIWCAYRPGDLPMLADYQLHIAIAGLSLLYCSVLAVFAREQPAKNNETNN